MSITMIAVLAFLVFLGTFMLGEWLARDGAPRWRAKRKSRRSTDDENLSN